MHVDVRLPSEADREGEVERLESLGASRLYVGTQGPNSWQTMADPEGNEFCVSGGS